MWVWGSKCPSVRDYRTSRLRFKRESLKLKLSEMANIAEIVAAAAIIVSLVYVGVQVNDSTRAVRSATANDISAAVSSWYITVGSNQQASQIYYGGMRNPDSLSPQEFA